MMWTEADERSRRLSWYSLFASCASLALASLCCYLADKQDGVDPPQSIHSVAIEGPTEIITLPQSITFTFDRATLGQPAPGFYSSGPDNSMDEAPGLHVVMVDPTNPDNQCLGTTSEGLNIHAHYIRLRIQLERMLAIESAQTEFSLCLQGPGRAPSLGEDCDMNDDGIIDCDLDGDADIDLHDFAVFQDEIDSIADCQ